MTEQKCEAVRVMDGTNSEDYYWPQDVRKLDEEVREMLEKLDLVEYEGVFKGEQLSLTDIAQLNHNGLKSIGISLVKHRTAIIKYTSGSSSQAEETGGEAQPGGGSSPVSSNDEAAMKSYLEVISEDEMLEVTDLVRSTGYYETSKVDDMEILLLRDIIRMVAFRHALPRASQQQLRDVLTRRFEKIAEKIKDFEVLPYEDQKEILEHNVPLLVEFQICTFFNPDLLWREQLTPLIGQEEVEKLDRRLKSLNVDGMDDFRI